MSSEISCIFEDMPRMFRKLKKETYEVYFSEFTDSNEHFFIEMIEKIDSDEDKDGVSIKLSEDFVNAIHDKFKNKKDIVPKSLQANLNVFMVYYVFPMILKCEGQSNNLLADKILESWRNRFIDSNISFAPYEEIRDNFRDKIFGIF